MPALVRTCSKYPRYAALLTDANYARIFVFGLGETLEEGQVKGKKVQRVKVGGWSQARYQRRVQNAHQAHAKEVMDVLERVVREDQIKHILIAGDLVDVLKLDIKASDQEVVSAHWTVAFYAAAP